MTIKIGDLLNDRYEIQGLIAEGTDNDYWYAQDNVLERTVRIQFHHRKSDGVSEQAYRDSLKLLANLEHPSILPLFDTGVFDNSPFAVTRYLPDGIPLREAVTTDTWNSEQILRFTRTLALAIDFAHNKGVAHYDLTPNNILIDSQGLPYIINFYLSPFIGRGYQFNKDYVSLGFVAPEVAEGKSATTSADLYSFVSIIYYIILMPYYWLNAVKRKEDEEPLTIKPYRTDLPLAVDLVIQRLTRLNPNERYYTATQAAEALNRAFYSGADNVEGQIFLSYARNDSEYVHKLAKELQRVGVHIWIDQDIEPGENWDEAIEKALNSCDKMLLIVSPSSVKSENVQDEWSYFLEEGKALYQFIYEKTSLPFRLRRRQYTTSTGDLMNDVARIVELLSGGTPTKLLADDL